MFDCVCMRVSICICPKKIFVVSALIKLKLVGEIEYTHISILQEINNDSLHDKKAKEDKITQIMHSIKGKQLHP